MKENEKIYRIGCSGYYYPNWKNAFYPKGLQPRNWLQYYSTIFNTVELNGTFYRIPKLADLKKYKEATPDDFTFSVKMNKSITHLNKLKNTKEQIKIFQDLIEEGLENKLACFLFQLPPTFDYNNQNLEYILENIPKDLKSIVELRHASWWNCEVERVFRNNKLTFCNVDYPGLNSFFISTSPKFYLRLHGNPQLFKSAYTTDQLKDFCRLFPPDCEQYTIYFNNTYYDAAYRNAMELHQMIQTQYA